MTEDLEIEGFEHKIVFYKSINYESFYICKNKELLIELANEFKQSWIEDLEDIINQLENLEISNSNFKIEDN